MFIDLFLELLGLVGSLVLICVLICIVSIMILFFKAIHEVFKAAKQVDKNKNKQKKEEKAVEFFSSLLKEMPAHGIQGIAISRPAVIHGYQVTITGKDKYECFMIGHTDVSDLKDTDILEKMKTYMSRVDQEVV